MVNGPTAQASNNGFLGELTFREYVKIGQRRRWWIIVSALGLFGASTVMAYRMPDIFRAETVILVDSQQVPDKYVPAIVTADIAGRLTTLQQQVLSPTRLKKLVEAEGLYPDPSGKRSEQDVILAVQKSITVEVVSPGAGKLGAFKIGYSSRNPNQVAPIANHLAQMFVEENLKARENVTLGTAQFLEDQLHETKRRLDDMDARLRSIKTRNILDLPESKPYHMEALATLRGQVQVIQDKINQDQRDRAILESMLGSGGPAPTVDVDAQEGGGGLTPDEAQLQKSEARLTELRSRYGPAHPDVRKAQAEINKLQKTIANTPHDASVPAVDRKPAIQPEKASTRHNPVVQSQIENLDEDIKQQNKLIQPLQERMEFHTSKLAQVPVFEQQIARLQQDYDILKVEYTGLLEKKQAAEMSYALEVHQKAERFVVLDAAQTPLKPAAPNRLLMSVAGLIGGLLVGMALAAGAEMNDESVRSENEAVRISGKPLLSAIPEIVSTQERLARRWRALGLIAGTMTGSVVVGFLLSFIASRLL